MCITKYVEIPKYGKTIYRKIDLGLAAWCSAAASARGNVIETNYVANEETIESVIREIEKFGYEDEFEVIDGGSYIRLRCNDNSLRSISGAIESKGTFYVSQKDDLVYDYNDLP